VKLLTENAVLLDEAVTMANWLQEHYDAAMRWEDPVGFCAWYISHGFCGSVYAEDHETVVAVVGMRPVKNLGDGAVPYRYDPDGEFVHIDFLVGTGHPLAIGALAATFRFRFGPRKSVCYFRRGEERLRVHSYDRFFRNMTRTMKESK